MQKYAFSTLSDNPQSSCFLAYARFPLTPFRVTNRLCVAGRQRSVYSAKRPIDPFRILLAMAERKAAPNVTLAHFPITLGALDCDLAEHLVVDFFYKSLSVLCASFGDTISAKKNHNFPFEGQLVISEAAI
ncbi:hypothetical protein [Celeribacter arenosi]|uniref:hypothetical protein n=1 Tax=Celeribacter arenosi TaxID=792649 RepID=UPI0031DB80A9